MLLDFPEGRWCRIARFVGLLASGLVVSACAALFDDVATLGPTVGEINAMPRDAAEATLADFTVMTYDAGITTCYTVSKYPTCSTQPGHGTQIEYFAPDGYNFLWYPGNSRPVYGVWKLHRAKPDARYDLCFRYQSNSYNPLTREHGGHWECRDFGTYVAGLKEVRRGDIFNLASGRLPHPLSPASTDFDALLAEGAAPSATAR